MELEPGTWMDDRYKILRFLGKGSEGSVYLAFQEKLFRFYAVKELKKEGICFSRESIEVWKTLHCSGLPEIADILETEDTVWIVSEYIEGRALQDILQSEEDITPAQAARWCLQIAAVLEYLHGQHPPILYGDLKPDNLIIRKNQMILVDMGSLIRQGSRGKRTGTKEYARMGSTESAELEDGYSFAKLMELLSGKCSSREMRKLAAGLIHGIEKEETGIFRKTQKQLQKIQRRGKTLTVIFLLSAGILLYTAAGWKKQIGVGLEKQDYHSRLTVIRMLPEEEKNAALMRLILERPEESEAYLELLHIFQEDLELDEEEETAFRKIWKQKSENDRYTCEEILKKNPTGYQKVAYEAGVTYWYYDKSLQGKKYAASWFQKIIEMPKEISEDIGLWERSMLYKKLGEYREKWRRYDETGEGEELFQAYWKDIRQLLEMQTQISMTRLMLWRESLMTWKHYMVELGEAGVSAGQIQVFLEQMQQECSQIPEGHRQMQEIKSQLEADEKEIEGMITRVLKK